MPRSFGVETRKSGLLRRSAAAAATAALCLLALGAPAMASSQVAISFDLTEVGPVVYRELGDASATVPDVGLNFPGYEFEGWNTEPDGSGAAVEVGTTLSSSTTLYAQWGERSTLDSVASTPELGGGEADDGTTDSSPGAASAGEVALMAADEGSDVEGGAGVTSDGGATVGGATAPGAEPSEGSTEPEGQVAEQSLGGIVSTFAGETTFADPAADGDGQAADQGSQAPAVPSGTTAATKAGNMPNTAQAPTAIVAVVCGAAVVAVAARYMRRHGPALIVVLALACGTIAAGAVPAVAGDGVAGYRADGSPISGTVTVDGRTWGWSGGELVCGRVVNIGGELMRFDDEGLIVVAGWHDYGGESTYFEEGDNVFDEVVQLEDGTYCYLGTSGMPVTGRVAVGDRVYFASESGSLLSPGWHVVGTEFGFDEPQIVYIDEGAHAALVGYSDAGYPHWTRPEGYVVRGKWQDPDGLTHLADEEGRLVPDGWVVTDLFDEGLARYWVDPETHATPRRGLVVIDGEVYTIGEGGSVLTGPTLSGGVLVLADEMGRCLVGTGWTDPETSGGSQDTPSVPTDTLDDEVPHASLEASSAAGRCYLTTGFGGEIGARVGLFEIDGVEYFADRETGIVVSGEHWDEETSTLYTSDDHGVVVSKVRCDTAPGALSTTD